MSGNERARPFTGGGHAVGAEFHQNRPVWAGHVLFDACGRSAVWSDRPADLTVTCDGPATARNPMDEVLSAGTPIHAFRTDGLHAIFLDRDVRALEGRPAHADETPVVVF